MLVFYVSLVLTPPHDEAIKHGCGLRGRHRDFALGWSSSRRWISVAGTCPSTTWMPIFAVWHKPSAFGMPRFSRAFLCAIERANFMETIHRELTENYIFVMWDFLTQLWL